MTIDYNTDFIFSVKIAIIFRPVIIHWIFFHILIFLFFIVCYSSVTNYARSLWQFPGIPKWHNEINSINLNSLRSGIIWKTLKKYSVRFVKLGRFEMNFLTILIDNKCRIIVAFHFFFRLKVKIFPRFMSYIMAKDNEKLVSNADIYLPSEKQN